MDVRPSLHVYICKQHGSDLEEAMPHLKVDRTYCRPLRHSTRMKPTACIGCEATPELDMLNGDAMFAA